MPKFRRLSGGEVVSILESFGFIVTGQRGSHMKLQRTVPGSGKQTLIVPNHRELDTGTCRALLRQAGKYIPMEEMLPHFLAE